MRQDRLVYFDGTITTYPAALAALFDAGVEPQAAIYLADSCARPSEEEAQFLFGRLLEVVKKGASSVLGKARAAGGKVAAKARDVHAKVAATRVGQAVGDKVKKVGGKLGGAIAKADRALGKAGGGDEECEWITVHGAKGTTRLCIDEHGTIKKGPKDLAGTKADESLKGHGGVEAAKGRAKAKREAFEHREKMASQRLAEWFDRINDVAEVALDPGAAALGAFVGKTLGERLGVVKSASDKLKKKLIGRYGPRGTAAIIMAGIVAAKGLDVAIPGAGTVLGALPGGQLVTALPVVAAVEGVRGLGKEAKSLTGEFERLLGFLRSHGKQEEGATPLEKSKRRKKKRQKADFACAGGDCEAPWQGGLSDAEVKKLGKKWWKEHLAACAEVIAPLVEQLKKRARRKKAG